jgi:hypothetical protein
MRMNNSFDYDARVPEDSAPNADDIASAFEK